MGQDYTQFQWLQEIQLYASDVYLNEAVFLSVEKF